MAQRVFVVVGLIAVVGLLWWGFSPDEETVVTYTPHGTVATRAPRAAGPRREPQPIEPAPVTALDASVELGEIDEEAYTGEVSKVSNAEIEQTLELNAAFAKANVARFCALADTLASEPLFKPLQGTRDATDNMTRLFGTHSEDLGSTALPAKIRQSLMAGDGLELTEEQLMGINFGWMRSMRDFDTLPGKMPAAAWGESAYTPPMKMPYYYVRLRFLRAAKFNDWEDAVKDVQAFATLLHTSSKPWVEVEAAKTLELELQTIDLLRAKGVAVPEHLPLPNADRVKLHAALAQDVFRFVAPKVDPAVQHQAFECAKRAGLECATAYEAVAYEAVANANDLRRVLESEPVKLDRTGCNDNAFKVLGREPGWYGASGANQRMRAESKLFGKLE